MATETNKAIALIIPLIVKNNAGKVALALRDAGYSKDFIPAPDLEARLFQLYNANPDLFFSTLKSIPWNYGETETNRPEIKDQLIQVVSQITGTEVSKDTWWPELLDIVNPAVQAEENTDAPTHFFARKGNFSYAIALLFILAVLGLIIALYILFT